MYSYSTRLAPQIVKSNKPVKPVSIWDQMNYVSPINKKFKGYISGGQPVKFVPA